MNHLLVEYLKRTSCFALCIVAAASLSIRASAETYTVKRGENLTTIANRFDVTVDDLISLNNIVDKNLIEPGQVLQIPGTTKSGSTDANTDVSAPSATPAVKTTSEKRTQSDGEKTLSLNIQNADVRDVLSALALSLGKNIIYKGETATVSLRLKDVTFEEALEYTANVAGLTILQDGSTIIVGLKEQLSADFYKTLEITRFRLKYITADLLATQIQTVGLSVQLLPVTTNQMDLWVQGFPADLVKIAEIIRMLDISANLQLGSEQIKNNFKSISVEYISASEFQQVLAQLDLPSGFTLEGNPDTLYVYASPEDFDAINRIKTVVDVVENYSFEGSYAAYNEVVSVKLNYITKDAASSLLANFGFDLQVIQSDRMQKSIWMIGSAEVTSEAIDILSQVDVPLNSLSQTFEVFRLYNITAKEMQAKLNSMNLPAISIYTFAYPEFSKSVLISCEGDLISSISDLIDSLDRTSPSVTLVVDSSEVENGIVRLNARRKLVAEMSGIPEIQFKISDNIARGDGYRYVMYLTASPEEIQRVIDLIAQIDSGNQAVEAVAP